MGRALHTRRCRAQQKRRQQQPTRGSTRGRWVAAGVAAGAGGVAEGVGWAAARAMRAGGGATGGAGQRLHQGRGGAERLCEGAHGCVVFVLVRRGGSVTGRGERVTWRHPPPPPAPPPTPPTHAPHPRHPPTSPTHPPRTVNTRQVPPPGKDWNDQARHPGNTSLQKVQHSAAACVCVEGGWAGGGGAGGVGRGRRGGGVRAGRPVWLLHSAPPARPLAQVLPSAPGWQASTKRR